MNSMKFTHTSSLRGELTVPGDKSISHRSVMFGALADGLTEIHGFLQGADCLSTISCFSKIGNLDRKFRARPFSSTDVGCTG